MKRIFLLCFALVSLLSLPVRSFAGDGPDATIVFSGDSVAAGVGYTWGKGELTYQGKVYPFRISGLSVVDIGLSHINGTGTVYNLKNVADISGTFVAAGAGATVAGGGSVAVLENQNGVIVHFHSTTAGLKLNLSTSGIVVKLK